MRRSTDSLDRGGCGLRANGDPLSFVLPVLWTAQGSYVRRREKVLEICWALRAPGLWEEAGVFSPRLAIWSVVRLMVARYLGF